MRAFCKLLLLVVVATTSCLFVKSDVAYPKANPFLSATVYGITHFDSSQSDTFPYAVRRGTYQVDLSLRKSITGGPINIMTLAAAQKGFFWLISSDRVAYADGNSGKWNEIAEIALPNVKQVSKEDLDRLVLTNYASLDEVEKQAKEILGATPQSVLTSGVYPVADVDNTVYVNTRTEICSIGLKDEKRPEAGLEIKRRIDTSKFFEAMYVPGTGNVLRLMGLGMTYDGHLVTSSLNAIAVLDRHFQQPVSVYKIESGQMISNSFAIDEDDGIYVASGSLTAKADGIMHKLVWTGSGISDKEADGAWSAAYDGGERPPSVKIGTGTGSTPTLMGFKKTADRLVVITDGANRMKIVAFWRDAIPEGFQQIANTRSRRIAGQMEISAGLPADTQWIQSEQSVVVNGWGAFVVNNIVPKGHSDLIVDVLALGPVIDPPIGMERVEWDPKLHAWQPVWTRGDVSSISMVPSASRTSGIVFVNGYSKTDGWEVTGMDWLTGQTVYRSIFGKYNYGNGAYALLQFLDNGDLLFNSIGGPFRISHK